MNIYIGNLAVEVTEEELGREFHAFGEVVTVTIMDDKYIGSGQPRRYGYVEMPSRDEGETAIAALNGKLVQRMPLQVIRALPLSGTGDSEIREGIKTSRQIRHTRIRVNSQDTRDEVKL
jgi:RNA recognition motif-containing protein